MRLSLAQELELHRQQGKHPLSVMPKDGGEFEVGVYSIPDRERARLDPEAWKSGQRVYREIKHNQMTNWLYQALAYEGFTYDPQVGVWISNDEKPVHKYGDFRRSTYITNGHANYSSWIIDSPGWLWTVTGTILAPAAGQTRNFRTVGFVNDTPDAWGTNSQATDSVLAATLLASMQTQDETQQVVVSYRLAWEEPANV